MNATDDPYSLTMYVIGDDQTEYEPVVIDVSAQYAVLSINEDSISWLSGGKDPVYGSVQTVVLTIENQGLVGAEEVIVKAEHQTSATSSPSGINASAAISVPAGMEGTAYLDLNFSTLSQGEAWIVFSVESVDGKEPSEPIEYPKKYNLQSPSVEEAGDATQVLMIVLIIILGGLLIVLTRRPGRKPNAPF